jgi:hypothetical protein
MVGACVGDREDEIDLSLELLGKRLSLELSGAELRLHVDQKSFNFDVEDSIGRGQHDVGGARITDCHWNLQLGVPASASRRHDGLGQGQLPGVTEPYGRDGIEPPSELVSGGRDHAAPSVQRDGSAPTLRPAHTLL